MWRQLRRRTLDGRLVLLLIVFACVFSTYECESAALASERPITKFGILYSVWHCLALSHAHGHPYNIEQALAGKQPWGPVPAFHFWAEPKVGYYCLSNRPDVLRLHAAMLRDAGIDFVIIDASNSEYADARTPDSPKGIIEPFRRLLAEWTAIRGAPKVVPFAPLTRNGDMFEFMMRLVDEHPSLRFIFRGKPLGLVTNDGRRFVVDERKYAELSQRYTLRRMWGLLPHRADPAEWSFMERCVPGFLASHGRAACRQRVTIRNGVAEQVPIAAAYQDSYMSKKATAVPKFHGRTFVKQFEALFEYPRAPIATISSWNEWMAQRFCLDTKNHRTYKNCSDRNDHFADGSKVFVDSYDVEYSRDIEPSKTAMGDYYYRLLKDCISKYREGKHCVLSDVSAAEPN
jgi:hypothetical protein